MEMEITGLDGRMCLIELTKLHLFLLVLCCGGHRNQFGHKRVLLNWRPIVPTEQSNCCC